jgi:nucleoside-diphosphate-sugar epimerase
MTTYITGASGFIGKRLVQTLLQNGKNIVAVVPDPEKLDDIVDNRLSVIKAGFSDFSKLSETVHEKNGDIFYYLAWAGYGKTTNDYAFQIENIKPVCDAVREASKLGCSRFVFTSSFSEFMISENEPLSHDQGASCNVYGSAKHAARILAQAVAHQSGIEFVSVAFANTFGPGDFSMRSTNLIIHKLLQGQPIDLTWGNHLYDWNYIEDTISGLILAAEKGRKDALYYIGNIKQRPLVEIVSEVRDILAPNVPIRLGTYIEDFHVDYSCVDVYLLYRDTGYRASTSFRTAIIKTAEWIESLHF